MRINLGNILFLFSGLFYAILLIIFFQDSFILSDANALYKYASNINLNPNTLLTVLPYSFENLYIVTLGIFTNSFLNQFNFVLLTSVITFLFALNTSIKIYEYLGISKINSTIFSIFSVSIFIFLPYGKLGLISTQCSFIALLFAYGTNTLFKPSIIYFGIHWVYVPMAAFIIFFQKLITIISTLKLRYSQFFIGILISFFGIYFLNFIGKLDNLLISVRNSSLNKEITFLLTISLILVNFFLFQFSKRQLCLNLLFISITAFIIAFLSSKTSNRLCITLIFYDYCFLSSLFLKTIFRKDYKINKIIK